ncbi:MAG TPA: hypothetical protein DDY34_16000 [Bacteroidales bacterium]|nr:hypothetical protein [Bacteroidales bacterium]
MKILDPKDNIDSLVSMVRNAKEFVVFVSPYSYLKGWESLKEAINEAYDRGIKFSYYVRKGEGSKGLEGLSVCLFEVEKLHAKMFFNERVAVISSFHLMNNQDINWAFEIDDSDEYEGLTDFFKTYIEPEAIMYDLHQFKF